MLSNANPLHNGYDLGGKKFSKCNKKIKFAQTEERNKFSKGTAWAKSSSVKDLLHSRTSTLPPQRAQVTTTVRSRVVRRIENTRRRLSRVQQANGTIGMRRKVASGKVYSWRSSRSVNLTVSPRRKPKGSRLSSETHTTVAMDLDMRCTTGWISQK